MGEGRAGERGRIYESGLFAFINSALGRLRQEDYLEFEASLVYTARTDLHKQDTNKDTNKKTFKGKKIERIIFEDLNLYSTQTLTLHHT